MSNIDPGRNADPGLGRLSAPPLPSLLPPPMQQNGAASATHLDHEGRIARMEQWLQQLATIVGRPPFLHDEGEGIARGIAEIHGSVTKTERLVKWGLAVLLGAVLASEGVRYAARVTVAPPQAAPIVGQQVVVQPAPAAPAAGASH